MKVLKSNNLLSILCFNRLNYSLLWKINCYTWFTKGLFCYGIIELFRYSTMLSYLPISISAISTYRQKLYDFKNIRLLITSTLSYLKFFEILKKRLVNFFSESIELGKAINLLKRQTPNLRISRAFIKNLMKRNYIDLLS